MNKVKIGKNKDFKNAIQALNDLIFYIDCIGVFHLDPNLDYKQCLITAQAICKTYLKFIKGKL